MRDRNLTILIIGAGNPIPSFIYRRLLALKAAGIRLIVALENQQKLKDLEDVEVVRIGGKQTLYTQVRITLRALIHFPIFFGLMSNRPDLPIIARIKWAAIYLPLVRISRPDIVHFQWLIAVYEFRWLRRYFHSTFIGSARGSQVTVYPITRQGYREKVRSAIAASDYIHCVSADMATACERMGASREKLIVNYNGIDLEKFTPREKAIHTAGFTLISVGSMIWRKGLIFQLQVLKLLVMQGLDVRLVWVGEGIDKEGLVYTANALGIDDRITFVGRVASEELPSLLTTADAYVSTSIAEGLANSVVEAIACGLPVVAFECEGMSEVVQDNVNGFIVPFGDCELLAEKIGMLLNKPQLLRVMGQAARKIAIDRFNQFEWTDRMIEKYEAIKA